MKNNRRLLLAWIIALGFIAFGAMANWYLVFVWAAQPTSPVVVNPYQALYDDLLYPSVRITTDEGIGSGVIIANEQVAISNEQCLLLNAQYVYILTAGHVVGNEALVNVELFGSTESLPAFVVATDTDKDLALLRIDNSSFITYHYYARLAPRNYVPYIFTPVWVIGCSLGYPARPTSGEITSVNESRLMSGLIGA